MFYVSQSSEIEVGENNISSLRVEMQKEIRDMAASGTSQSKRIVVTPPEELNRLIDFNEAKTKKIFEPAMAKVLDAQWRNFKFFVRLYSKSKKISVTFEVKDNLGESQFSISQKVEAYDGASQWFPAKVVSIDPLSVEFEGYEEEGAYELEERDVRAVSYHFTTVDI